MSFPFDTNDMLFPGLDSVLETVQNQFWWGRESQQTFAPCTVSGAARDSGNTVTTVLRGGLLMGKVTATGLLKEWNALGTDGTEIIYGILAAPLTTQDAGADADRYTYVMVAGNVLSDRLVLKGNATEGIVGDTNEFNIVNQMQGRFLLDKHHQMGISPLTYRPRYMTAAEVAADAVTVTTADHGKTFYFGAADGATAVTLPEPQVGLTFTFVNPANLNVTLDMATGKFITPGSVTQDTIVLSLGESCRVVGVTTGLYYAEITEAATD